MFINTNVLTILVVLCISLYFMSYFQKLSIVKESFEEDFQNKCVYTSKDIENIGKPKYVPGEVVKQPGFKELLNMHEEKTPCNPGYITLSPGFWD